MKWLVFKNIFGYGVENRFEEDRHKKFQVSRGVHRLANTWVTWAALGQGGDQSENRVLLEGKKRQAHAVTQRILVTFPYQHI